MDEKLIHDAEQPVTDEGSAIERFGGFKDREAAHAAPEEEPGEPDRENITAPGRQDANSQIREEIERFTERFPDCVGLYERMAEEIEKHPEWDTNNALINAYASVLSKTKKTAEEFLADEEFVREKILSDPKLKERIISEYLSGTDGVKLPLSRGIPAASANRPQSIEDAGRLLEEMLR
jgi:hypothetical protein